MLAEVVTDRGKRIKSKVIAKAYTDGDPLTVRVLNDTADLIGVAAANAITLLSIPRIVLGGGLTEAAGPPFVDRVAESMRRHVFPDRAREAQVVASTLEDNAGVIGAALLARDRLQ
jgi:glucokinase